LKAYCSRALNNLTLDQPNRPLGAARQHALPLEQRAVSAAIHYGVREQGEAMAVYEMPPAGLFRPVYIDMKIELADPADASCTMDFARC